MTDDVFTPSPVTPALYDVLAAEGLGRDLFDPHQHACCERVEHFVRHLAYETLRHLGAVPPDDAHRSVTALAAAGGLDPTFAPRLRWLLDLLVSGRVLANEEAGYRLAQAPIHASADLAAAALTEDPRYAPTYELLAEAAKLYPRVARGETLAEPALLARPRLWVRYFSNDNPYYALGNHVAARAAAGRLSAGARVLEVGGGLGSSAAAFFAAAVERGVPPSRYRLTDPVPFFRRRAERELVPPAGCAVEALSLDMNAPWEHQDVAPGAWDLVWGVNAFHLARSQRTVLEAAWKALRPGGLLVLGEGLRREPGVPEAAEFPFQLLESYHAVTMGDDRPHPGFPHPPVLARALASVGFTSIEVVPDPDLVRPHYAGFLGGAICARRPADRSESAAT